jgi:hypothetical protein
MSWLFLTFYGFGLVYVFIVLTLLDQCVHRIPQVRLPV